MSFLSKGGGSAPQAPDPTTTAAAQTRSNLDTAIANARLNRTNQTTPWGSISWQEGPVDANGVPTWSSNVQLSPEQQRLLEYQQQQQQTRAQMAQQLLASMQGTAATRPLDFSGLNPVPNARSPGGMWNGAAPGGVQQPPAPQAPPPGGPPYAPRVGGMPANPGTLKPAPLMPSVGSATQGAPVNPLIAQAAQAAGGAGSGLDGNTQQILAKLLRGQA